AREVAQRLVPTLVLAAAGCLVAVVVGMALGLTEAATRSRLVRGTLRGLSLVLVSVPGFALAFLLVAQFSLPLDWFPTQGMTGGWQSLVLPALVLGLPAGAATGRGLASRPRAAAAAP